MRYNSTLIATAREAPSDAQTVSHVLLARAGYVRRVGSGVYSFLPLGVRVLRKLEALVRAEMTRAGAHELLLPALLPAELYRETGRWDSFGSALFRLKDRKDADYLLGPTHEEVITDLARQELKSYRDLPKTLFQIQTKFRDEPRPRAGLLRCREFTMKDAYSFDADETSARASYARMRAAYQRIFGALGLDYRAVTADSGDMGGSLSEEFQVLVDSGEDSLAVCASCEHAANLEVAAVVAGDPCPKCGAPLQIRRGIEAGHVFLLGTRYSAAMRAQFVAEDGALRPLVMGCYGIGVSRLIATVVEQHHDADGICWPVAVAPYDLHVVQLGEEPAVAEQVARAEAELEAAGVETLVDDRPERPGAKFKDADLIGAPLRLTIGARGLAKGNVELKRRTGGQPVREVPVGELVSAVTAELSALGRAIRRSA